MDDESVLELEGPAENLVGTKGLSTRVFKRMSSFIRAGKQARGLAEKILHEAKKGRLKKYTYRLKEIRLLSPIDDPSKIVCTGLNFEDYRRILGLPYTAVPQIFLKAPSTIIGPNQPVRIPMGYGTIFHEWELACVIGKDCKDLTEEEAKQVIFGYTIFDDITAHDLEVMSREFQPWAKSMDTFAPMGPYIVTADELPDPYNVKMVRRRNGAVECESSTSQMRFKLHEIISFVSSFSTLFAGDVITGGSPPAGPIQPGDHVEAEIEGIGILANKVEKREVRRDYAARLGLRET